MNKRQNRNHLKILLVNSLLEHILSMNRLYKFYFVCSTFSSLCCMNVFNRVKRTQFGNFV